MLGLSLEARSGTGLICVAGGVFESDSSEGGKARCTVSPAAARIFTASP